MAVPFTSDRLALLPRWAVVAFAARCARRVVPLLGTAWPDAPQPLVLGITEAVAYVEDCAGRGATETTAAQELAFRADYASEHAPDLLAYSAAHAAANAVGTLCHPGEAARAAYWAASDAAKALELASPGPSPAVLLADLEYLERLAAREGWTDTARVPSGVFAPLDA